MRNRQPPGRAGQDRWLVSYADLVTLLFACFTTAYAASVGHPPEQAPVVPVEAAIVVVPAPVVPPPVLDVPPISAPEGELPPPKATLRDLIEPALAGALADAQIEIIEDERGLVISLPESATFSSGSADLTVAARSFFNQFADALRATDVRIRVEGHTDDMPIRGGRYRSNWELSTARASAVVVFMVTDTGFEPWRLSAAGYGEFHPRAENSAPESRALNRRVDVVVIEADEAAEDVAETAEDTAATADGPGPASLSPTTVRLPQRRQLG